MHLKEADQSLLIFTLRPFQHLQIKRWIRCYVARNSKDYETRFSYFNRFSFRFNYKWKRFFILSPREDADPRFTRDGSFSLDATGNLVTTEGFNVAGYTRNEDGSINYGSALPINIPLTIESSDGRTILLVSD